MMDHFIADKSAQDPVAGTLCLPFVRETVIHTRMGIFHHSAGSGAAGLLMPPVFIRFYPER
jgi:hypothetical protein